MLDPVLPSICDGNFLTHRGCTRLDGVRYSGMLLEYDAFTLHPTARHQPRWRIGGPERARSAAYGKLLMLQLRRVPKVEVVVT